MDKDTLQGKGGTTLGHAKQAAGNLMGNDELQAEGAKDQVKGQLHETVGAAKDASKEIAAGIKEGVTRAKERA